MGSDYSTAGGQTPMATTANWMNLLPQISQLLGGQGGGIATSGLQTLNQLFNPADVNKNLTTAKGNNAAAQQAAKDAQQAYNKNPNPTTKAALQAALQQVKFSGSAMTTAEANAAGGQPLGLNQLNAQNATAFGNTINPNYKTAQDAASKGSAAAVNAIDLKGLSPGEANAVERSLNQTNTSTGNAGLINPTNVISNAMNFGGAFNSKIPLMTGAAQGASQAANSATSMGGFAPLQAQPLQAQAQQNAFTAGPQIFGSMTSGNVGAQGAGAQMAGQTSIPSYLTAASAPVQGCCFIFLESYHGMLPPTIRRARDKYYCKHPRIANGYKRMAKWLVPSMKANRLVRWLVWKTMVEPITKYSLVWGRTKERLIAHFWLRTWAIIGS